MKLEQLVYISTATSPIGPRDDLPVILSQSVRNNPANNITGALTFTDTQFVQLLEGSPGSLDVIILRLMLYPRHRDVTFIDRAPIAARSFKAWSMASPALTPEGHLRLAAYLSAETRPMGDFQRLLLDMIDEESGPARPHA